MTHFHPQPDSLGEPDGGPQARDAHFMTQRLAGNCQTTDLRQNRRDQLHQHRKNLAYHQAFSSENALQIPATAQKVSALPPIIGDQNWIPLGPATSLNGQAGTTPPVSGRVEAIAVSANGQTIYIGSANGGIWRSTNGGNSWTPTMNAFNLQPNALQADSLSIGALVLDPGNPKRIFVGTGEGGSAAFAGGAASASGLGYFGVGPVYSPDGGNTWFHESMDPAPPAAGLAFFPMALDPLKPNRIVAPTTNGLFTRESRNEASFPGAVFFPQSYLLQYKKSNGAITTSYWNQAVDNLTDATNFGPAANLKDYDQIIYFPFNGIPAFLCYKNGDGSYRLFFLDGNGGKSQKASGNFTANRQLMAFNLNGVPHLALYDQTNGGASVLAWNDDFTTQTVQANLAWPAGWTLLPLVVYGSPFFIGYNAGDGSYSFQQWLGNGKSKQIRSRPAASWPTGAQLVAFELLERPYFMRYVTATGAYVIERIEPDLTFQIVRNIPNNSVDKLPTGMTMVGFTANDAPYVLGYKSNNGATNVYKYNNGTQEPELKVSKNLDGGRTLVPMQMGFIWNRKVAAPKNAGDQATAVVAARKGAVTHFFAAFSDGPVFRSVDGGKTWAQIGGDPGFQGRVSLTVQPGNADVLYSFDSVAIVRRLDTTNPVNVWQRVTGTPDLDDMVGHQGDYDLVIAVHPNDVDKIILGGSTILFNNQYSAALYRGEVDTCTASFAIKSTNGKMTYIGNSVHADIHALTFDPNVPDGAWVGSDGGAFYTADILAGPDPGPDVALNTIFSAKNNGLNTMTLEQLGQHPTYDAVLFAGSQDNGCQRYLGSPAWEVVFQGDAGGVIVNRADPKKVITSYVNTDLYLSTQSGNANTFNGNVSIQGINPNNHEVLFYAPFTNPPASSGQPDYVIFGAIRPFISKDFGTHWQSLPNGDATDNLPSLIRSVAFAETSTVFYVGTMGGQIYRFTKKLGQFSWTATQLNTQPGNPPAAPVTGIAVKKGDKNSIYVCYGGRINPNGWKRVWYYNHSSKTWTAVSGPNENSPHALLNLQHNAIVGTANNNELYVASDIGVYKTIDGGTNWQPIGNGLPEAAVLGLAYFPANNAWNAPAFLRASTYGRGVYEWIFSNQATFKNDVQLYIRDTILDRGIYPTVDDLTSPVDSTVKLSHRNSPDIKLIQKVNNPAPPPNKIWPAGFNADISFTVFAGMNDLATQLTRPEEPRAFIQIHQRGPRDAENTKIRVFLSKKIGNALPTTNPTPSKPSPAPKPPILPNNLVTIVQNDQQLPNQAGDDWQSLPSINVQNLISGQPVVKFADLDPLSFPQNGVYCLLVVLQHPDDPFTNNERDADKLAVADRKVAMKYLFAST